MSICTKCNKDKNIVYTSGETLLCQNCLDGCPIELECDVCGKLRVCEYFLGSWKCENCIDRITDQDSGWYHDEDDGEDDE